MQYKSEALAAAHETVPGQTAAGVMAKRTKKVFDEICLTPVADRSLGSGGSEAGRTSTRPTPRSHGASSGSTQDRSASG